MKIKIIYNTKKEDILKLSYPCKCNKCENPCKFGSGVLADGDYENIKNYLGLNDEQAKEYFEEIEKFNTKRLRPKILRDKNKLPYGKCIFYDEKIGCKIHPVKPLECKIAMGCKDYGEELILWMHLNHFLNPKDIESLRQYKNYIESGGKILEGAEIENFLDNEKKRILENYQDKKIEKDWEKELGLK
ncbi:MAG: YkgJ family cysteine cluster protein [Candidatus Woesearchaeota archaeon]